VYSYCAKVYNTAVDVEKVMHFLSLKNIGLQVFVFLLDLRFS
jgi:hypothetical protein